MIIVNHSKQTVPYHERYMSHEAEWITVQEASIISGYSQQYLRRILRSGKVQARKFGTVWQVNRQSFKQYLQTAKDVPDRRWGPKED